MHRAQSENTSSQYRSRSYKVLKAHEYIYSKCYLGRDSTLQMIPLSMSSCFGVLEYPRAEKEVSEEKYITLYI